ncbi:MAG TPA: hypothetical protein VMG10_30180 [Gemmataceae bacterium]|nr:hypothetical protein [Gemmataceae bacterium]
MRSLLRSLLWKEWHERKWLLALASAWILVGVAYGVGYEATHRVHGPVASFSSASMFFGVCAAVFVSMRTSLGEVTQRTLGYSASLPVSLRLQAGVRLGGAVVTIIGPILLGALVLWLFLLVGLIEQGPARVSPIRSYMQLPQRPPLSGLEAGKLIGMVTAVNLASSVQLLLILSVIGTRRRAESHLGFLGVCGACLWLLLSTVPNSRSDPNGEGDYRDGLGAILPQSLLVSYGYKTSEGEYGDLKFTHSVWAPLAVNLPVLTVLAWWFTRRYGTIPPTAVEGGPSRLRWRFPAFFSHLPIRWPGRCSALVWLDLRQALPMCLAGLMLATLLAAANVLSPYPHFDPQVSWQIAAQQLTRRIAGRLSDGTWITAILWGAVVGSGVFAGELQPRLEQFWRSRPISPSLWFWVKFSIGLAAVLGVLDLVTLVLAWRFPCADATNMNIYAYIACFPLLHALTYTLAVTAICWLRQAVVAGMAAILSLFFVFSVLQAMPGGANPIDVYNKLSFHANHLGEPLDLTKHGYPVVYGTVAVIIVAASLAAWRGALRPSLGRRART